MAKSVHNDVLDGALNIIKNNANKRIACSAQPTTYTEANATYALADVAVASGDFTIADGDTSGRKVTIATKNGVTVDANGTATHEALVDTATSRLLYVTTVPSQALSLGGTADMGFWKIEIADPA